MKKSYLIFSAQYLPTMGGVERYTYNLSKQLVKKGGKVTIVTSQIKDMPSFEEQDSIKIYRLNSISLLNGRYPIVKVNTEVKNILKKLAKEKFDLVIVNTRFYPLSVLGAKFAFENNLKSIVIEHGTNHLTVNNKFLDFAGEKFEHMITKKIKKYCKNFYGVSNACNEWLNHFDISAKGTIYNAINLDDIQMLANNPVENYRKVYNIKNDDVVVCFTGRLVKEKGILELINAVKRLNKDNVFLLAAGEGPLLNEVKKFENENIKILGKLDFKHVIALLKSSDIFCLPSESEGFPTSVLEAVALKNFVITTDKGGSKELINNRELGIIMKTNDSNEIYENLEFAIENSNYRKKAAELAYNRLVENFTWDIVSNEVIKIASEKD